MYLNVNIEEQLLQLSVSCDDRHNPRHIAPHSVTRLQPGNITITSYTALLHVYSSYIDRYFNFSDLI